jgi:hypothetical protein
MPEATGGVGVGDELDVRVAWIGVPVVTCEAETEDEATSGEAD